MFSNPHVSKIVLMLMMIMGNKDNSLLSRTVPVPWPSPLTRVVSLDSLSPVLSLTDLCVSWIPPQLVTSLEPPLGPGWHPRTHILIFTYPAQEINYLDLITLEDGTGAPNSRLFFSAKTKFVSSFIGNFRGWNSTWRRTHCMEVLLNDIEVFCLAPHYLFYKILAEYSFFQLLCLCLLLFIVKRLIIGGEE